jgi:hypothetical protein
MEPVAHLDGSPAADHPLDVVMFVSVGGRHRHITALMPAKPPARKSMGQHDRWRQTAKRN